MLILTSNRGGYRTHNPKVKGSNPSLATSICNGLRFRVISKKTILYNIYTTFSFQQLQTALSTNTFRISRDYVIESKWTVMKDSNVPSAILSIKSITRNDVPEVDGRVRGQLDF